jgi:dolichol-phosphate mannosyltransferase
VLGGGTVNWPWYRKLISKGGSLYARTILGAPLDDFTGGFKAWRAEALRQIDLTNIISNGYSFSVEMNYRAFLKGFRIVQIPITFVDRRVGETKMSKKIFFEAVLAVWKFRMNKKDYQ